MFLEILTKIKTSMNILIMAILQKIAFQLFIGFGITNFFYKKKKPKIRKRILAKFTFSRNTHFPLFLTDFGYMFFDSKYISFEYL